MTWLFTGFLCVCRERGSHKNQFAVVEFQWHSLRCCFQPAEEENRSHCCRVCVLDTQHFYFCYKFQHFQSCDEIPCIAQVAIKQRNRTVNGWRMGEGTGQKHHKQPENVGNVSQGIFFTTRKLVSLVREVPLCCSRPLGYSQSDVRVILSRTKVLMK